MKKNPSPPSRFRAGLFAPLLLLGVIALLFWRSFATGYVHFSNDGPLGQQNVNWLQLPAAITGMWDDLNDVGASAGTYTPSVRALISWTLGPVGYSKFYAPISLFILGLGAWTFFRALKLSPLAAALGAMAAMLTSTFFAGACWGIASLEIAVGFDFLALALVMASRSETPWLIRWTRLALAGLCVGMNVIEAADVGALCSLLVAGFVFYKSLAEAGGNFFTRTARGCGYTAIVAVFAGFIAFQAVFALVGNSITGVAGTAQDPATKAANWDKATQWSMPKKETLALIVPGLFGYKMDTPHYMPPGLQDFYKGGAYWGGIGRDPSNDRYFENGGQGSPPRPDWMRQTGGGNYCGILVLLIAAWAVAQSLRRQNSPFTDAQKRMIWFWAAVLAVSVPLMWGRFAPFSKTSDGALFYALLYKLPYFSTIRNPVKFVVFFAWGLAILFAYGVHALQRRYLDSVAIKSSGPVAQLKNWWAKAGAFDRRWTFALAGIFGASVIGWLFYAAQKPALISYLQTVMAPGDPNEIATFSISQAGWFVLIFTLAAGLFMLVIAGFFSGKRAKLGGFLLGLFLVIDLGRANLPYIIYWNIAQKYEVGALNPVEDFLRDKPYEHRVAKLLPMPLSTPSQFELFDQLYEIEWKQHHFPYYNIQSLDIIQMPRMPEDMLAYKNALRIGIKQDASGQYMLDEATFPKLTRLWELSNTRYLLGPAGFIDLFNAQFDPGKNRFRIVQRFSVGLKPDISQFHQRLEELTAAASPDGDLALFEFTGALPRAKLYSNWQVNTNDPANLKTLADANFDPAKTVLISTPQKDLPDVSTNENSGTVEFKSYAPKDIVFSANAAAPSVLLLNDRFDPDWRVTVDGKSAPLLRCNFIMRGVYLTPGNHMVEFQFSMPDKPLYVTLAAIVTGICLLGLLVFLQRRNTAAET
jgi:hypothetical protein